MTATDRTTGTTQSGLGAKRPLGDRIYWFLRSLPTWLLWALVVVWTIPTFRCEKSEER